MGKIWDNIKFLSIAGVGLFGDGYLNITIGLVVPMIGYLYYADEKHSVPTVPQDVIKGALNVSRHKIYGKELLLTIFGTLMVIVAPTYLGHSGILAWITVFRIITGMGTGGDYPMTSSLSAERNPMRTRAVLVLTVFSFIGLGSFSAGIVYVILLAAFKGSIHSSIHHLQWVWRLLFGIGLVPLILTVYARLTMRESKPYEKYVATDTGLVGKNKRGLKQQFHDFREYFANWKHARTLFAVCACWFLYDIAFYGINLNQSVILTEIGYGKGKTAYETLWHTAVGNIIVSCAGYLPGFYIGIFLPDTIGRKWQQFGGSAIVAVLYAIWAGVFKTASVGGLMTLFTLSQLFLNAGPNCTTFLLPAEVFPTRVRGTAHGIAAASGKAGAVFTAFAFGTITDRIGITGVLGLFAGVMALCAAISLMIPETKGKSIEDIEHGVLYGEAVSASDVSVFSGEVLGVSEASKDGSVEAVKAKSESV